MHTAREFKYKATRQALHVAILYALLGVVYISSSDYLAERLVGIAYFRYIQTFKGIGYIIITAVGLYTLLVIYLRRVNHLVEERVQTDFALLAALERFPGPTAIFRQDGPISYINAYTSGLLNVSNGDLEGKERSSLVFEQNFQGLHQILRDAFSGGKPISGEIVFRNDDQESFFMATLVPTSSHSDGAVNTVIMLAYDISARKSSSIRRDVQRRELRQIIDLIPNFIFAKDADGHYIMVNEAFCKFYDSSPQEIIGHTVETLLPNEEMKGEMLEQDEEVLKYGKTVYRAAQTVTGASGERRTFQVTKIPFRAAGDNRVAILCIALDITEQLKREWEIQRSRQQFGALVEHSLDALFVYDETETITLVNEKACSLVNRRACDLVGKGLSSILLGDRLHGASLPLLENGMNFQMAMNGTTSDSIPVEIRVGRLPGDDGATYLAEIRDISERLRVEREGLVLSRLGVDLSGSRSTAETGRALFNAVCSRLHVDAFFFAIRISGKSRFRYKLIADRVNGEIKFYPDFDLEIPMDSPVSDFYDGKPKLILHSPDEAESPELFPIGESTQTSQSLLFVPITLGDKVIALLSVQSYQFNAYGNEDLDLVQRMANMAGPALESAQADRRATIFARLGRQLGAAHTAEDVAEHVAAMADELTGWDCCVIALYAPEEETIIYIYLADVIDGERKRLFEPNPFKKPRGYADRVLNEGPFLILRDALPKNGEFVPLSRSPRPSLSMIWVPIPGENGPTGFISLQSYMHQAYDDNDLETTWALAEHCGAALNRTASQELLRYTEERYRLAIESTGAAAYQLDYFTKEYLFMGQQIEAITGYPTESFSQELWEEITLEMCVESNFEEIAGEEPSGKIREFRSEMRIRRPDGEERWISDQAVQLHNAVGNAVGTLGILRDITEQKRHEIALRASEERYALAARGANDGLWDWNLVTNKIHFSDRWGEMLGLEPEEISEDPDRWFELIHKDDLATVKKLLQAHLDGSSEHLECELRTRHKNGEFCWMLVRGIAVRDKDGKATRIAGSQTDITDRVHTQNRLLHDALHDPLTGLPNRMLLMDHLDRCLDHMRRRNDYRFALVFMDLDRFKNINDSLGHITGDKVLITTAQRLKLAIRPNDLVARFAGDEFALVLDNVTSEEEILEIVARAQQVMSEPITVDSHEIMSTASAGVALGAASYANPNEVLRDADNALYKAKADGAGRCRLFDTSMHEQAVKTLHLEAELRRVIERDQLELYFQPIVNVKSGKLERFEALLRWQHPERGIIGPDLFIPIAEETGLIFGFDEWVIGEACRWWKKWQQEFEKDDAGDSELRINLNLSPRHFMRHINLAERFTSITAAEDVSPNVFGLEITETALLTAGQESMTALASLKEAGFSLYLDDFGKGYSSLSYLHNFPFDMVKIDRLFVMRMQDEGPEREIVQAIVTLSDKLKLGVVAEGVETAKQMEIVRHLGCDAAQGYYISHPIPAEEVLQMIASSRTW